MIVIKKDKTMLEITIKIDGKNVTVNENGVQVEDGLEHLYDEMFKGIKSKDFEDWDDEEDDFNKVTSKTTSSKQHLQPKPLKLEKYLYDDILYAKVGAVFMRFLNDNSCEQIASSTYYKYKKRLSNEA